jgi:hypothetical protein
VLATHALYERKREGALEVSRSASGLPGVVEFMNA